MKEEHKKLYEKLVHNWSALFKLKVGDLFSREELAQEVWLAILEAEDSDTWEEEGEASLETYLGHCIRNHMFRLLTDEVSHVSALGMGGEDELEDFGAPIPDSSSIALDLDDKLRERVASLTNKYGTPLGEKCLFILDRIDTHTLVEITKEANEAGIAMSLSYVGKLRKRIEHELKKMLKE